MNRLLRRADVEALAGMGKSKLYALIGEGQFPRPVKIGKTAVRWLESDVAEWMRSLPLRSVIISIGRRSTYIKAV